MLSRFNYPIQAAELLEDHTSDTEREALTPLTTAETAKLAGWFCLLWFIANWTLAVGLRYTTVASATILSSMSGTSHMQHLAERYADVLH